MATLTVTITEAVTINGKDQGGTYGTFENTSITQTDKRLVKCAAGVELTLYKTGDTQADAAGGATWDDDSVKYVRITNLAGTSAHSILRIKNANDDEWSYKLSGTESFLLWQHEATMDATAGAAITLGSGDNDVVSVSIKAISSAQTVELFIASTDAA